MSIVNTTFEPPIPLGMTIRDAANHADNDGGTTLISAVALHKWASYIKNLEAQLTELRAENERIRQSLAEIREVWAGSDGFTPETCPEGYLQKLLKDCYKIAVEALK